ncbi:hypothetical protein [Mycobacterium kiyosense]
MASACQGRSAAPAAAQRLRVEQWSRPGSPPPNWEGPPPAGGWNGPAPAGGWNQPWQGTPVDASYGQNYYAPFTYNDFTVLPVFNADYGGFGYWFFGTWIPLY